MLMMSSGFDTLFRTPDFLDLPEVGGAELVHRDRLVVLVLVVEGVEASRDGI